MRRESEAGRRVRKLYMAFVAVMFVVMVVVTMRTDLMPERTRHEHFVAALWPKTGMPGRELRFTGEKAVLYKDPGFPLTWHVCTATKCGRYFEDEGDAERSK